MLAQTISKISSQHMYDISEIFLLSKCEGLYITCTMHVYPELTVTEVHTEFIKNLCTANRKLSFGQFTMTIFPGLDNSENRGCFQSPVKGV